MTLRFFLSTHPNSERAESIGETVGYQIRLEKMAEEASTKLLFCTTGTFGGWVWLEGWRRERDGNV